MRSTRLFSFWAIVIAFLCLAKPARAEQGEQQQCKQEKPPAALCCRVVTKGDHHPPQWTTWENMDAIWTTMLYSPSDVNIKNYKREVRKVSPPRDCQRGHKH